jgi:hypothetical protein
MHICAIQRGTPRPCAAIGAPARSDAMSWRGGRVLLAVEGAAASDVAVERQLDGLRAAGYETIAPPIERALGRPPTPRLLLVVPVEGDGDAQHAVRAALRGFSVLAIATGDRAVLDRLYDDLRRFGRLEVRSLPPNHPGDGPGDVLGDDARALLQLLADGLTLGEAASRLHLSRRTADRRLAAARAALGASTTNEAVARLRSTPGV